MREAHERLRAMAQRVAQAVEPPRSFLSAELPWCVDSTLAAHLRQIDALKQSM